MSKQSGFGNSTIFVVGSVCIVAALAVVYLLHGGGELKKLRELIDRADEVQGISQRLQWNNHMICLIRKLEPLDTEDEINAVVDIYLLVDPDDGNAAHFAKESLIQHAEAALPVVEARIEAADEADDPGDLDTLIAAIEKSLPEDTEDGDAYETEDETDSDELTDDE